MPMLVWPAARLLETRATCEGVTAGEEDMCGRLPEALGTGRGLTEFGCTTLWLGLLCGNVSWMQVGPATEPAGAVVGPVAAGGAAATACKGFGAMCICFTSPGFLMCSEMTDLSLFSRSRCVSAVRT